MSFNAELFDRAAAMYDKINRNAMLNREKIPHTSTY
jgi:hypothetical protein